VDWKSWVKSSLMTEFDGAWRLTTWPLSFLRNSIGFKCCKLQQYVLYLQQNLWRWKHDNSSQSVWGFSQTG